MKKIKELFEYLIGRDATSLVLKREKQCSKCKYFLLVDNDELDTHFCRRHNYRIYYTRQLPCCKQ